MAGLRTSADLQSVRTRHIVVQNQDSTFPAPFSLLDTDKKGRGVTEWIQDISVNSVTLFGTATTGVLTYSDVSGLLLNAQPFGSGSVGANGPPGATGPTGPTGTTGSNGIRIGLTSANAGVGVDISGTPFNPLIGLLTPVTFNPVTASVTQDELIQSYNELLAILNGKIITVNLPDPITPITVIPAATTAQLSWSPAPPEYVYRVYLNGVAQFPSTVGPSYTLSGLSPNTSYTVAVAAFINNVFSTPLAPTIFQTLPLVPPIVNIIVGTPTSFTIPLSWSPVDASLFTYNLYYRDASIDTDTIIYGIPGDTTVFYTLTNLLPGTTYSIDVRSQYEGQLGPSNPIMAMTSSPIISFSFSDPYPSGYGPLIQNGTVTDNIVGFSMVPKTTQYGPEPGYWQNKQFNRMTLPLQCNSGTTVSVNVYNYPPTNAGNIINIGSATQVVVDNTMKNYTFNFNSIITLIYNIYNFNGTFIIISCNSGTITVPTYDLNGIYPAVTMVALKGQNASNYSSYPSAVFSCQFFLV